MDFLFKVVRKEISAGILVGGVCLSGILWFLVYTQEKVSTFSAFSIYSGVESEYEIDY